MLGKVFGRWTVCASAGRRSSRDVWRCRCACGVERDVLGQTLRCGDSKSCGCMKRELAAEQCVQRVTHGQSSAGKWTPTYRSWANMHWRVKSPSPKSAPYYRDRGIAVCERWSSFEAFLSDMGERPSKDLSLDRIDNDLGYEPGNCRWATASEQAFNRRPSQRTAAA